MWYIIGNLYFTKDIFYSQNLTVECHKLFLKVYWVKNTINNPCDYVQPIVLEMGLCFTLNMVPHENIFSEPFHSV